MKRKLSGPVSMELCRMEFIRDVLFNSIHFKIDLAIFSVQSHDMVHVYDKGPVTPDHLGKRPELVLNTFKGSLQ